LTDTGREQVRLLGARLEDVDYDVVVSSDLGRAASTAAAVRSDFATSAAWREPDLGAWEGLTYEEVKAMSPEALEAFTRGEDVRLGGAERLSECGLRLVAAYRELVAAVGPDGTALVVSHGLAIAVLTGMLLGTRRPNPLALPGNTGLLHLHAGPTDRLVIHNDTSHLNDPPISFTRGTEVVFIRHGQTTANLERRWQGQLDGELTEEGRQQAKGAIAGLPKLDALYTSRLGRAVQTAEIIGDGIGLEPQVVAGVEEFGFGAWEGLTRDEIRAADPETAGRLFDDDEDVVRGGTGETWQLLRDRVTAAVSGLATEHEGGRIGIVSHGAATRAFANQVLDIGFKERRTIASMRNSAYARCELGPRGERILEWNIAPHLEG
jgi:probable phosphoglycerate mutase